MQAEASLELRLKFYGATNPKSTFLKITIYYLIYFYNISLRLFLEKMKKKKGGTEEEEKGGGMGESFRREKEG